MFTYITRLKIQMKLVREELDSMEKVIELIEKEHKQNSPIVIEKPKFTYPKSPNPLPDEKDLKVKESLKNLQGMTNKLKGEMVI